MRSKVTRIGLGVLVLVLLFANVALAHWWSTAWTYYHFHKSTLDIWVFGPADVVAACQAAEADWDSHTDLTLNIVGSHDDISCFGGNYGATGWWGLATLVDTSWYWHCFWWCGIAHAHSQFNTFYGGSAADKQGVQCQELGHTFGLDHSNTGDCMGKGYYNNINVTGAHNWADINAQY